MSDSYWTLVKPVWDEVSIYDGADAFLRDFDKVPRKAGVLLASHWTQSEIMVGGLGGFFSNPTGVLAPEAVEAFLALGMPRCAALLSEAMRFFGEPYPREQIDRVVVFERFHEEQGEGAIPMREQEDAIAVEIEQENGGFENAADRFAAEGVNDETK